jgi:UV damage endonuclease UvdE
MTTHTTPKIGFACKWIDRPDQVDGVSAKDDAKKYNTGTTTVAWLSRQSKAVAEERLWDLMKGNIEATRKLVTKVGELDEGLRMVRLSSDILPVYTHADWRYFWQLPDVRQYLERHFADAGSIARERGVRLSFHPGQFTVLASDNPGIVETSIEEFEYHVDMARFMGYGQKFQDFKINVHISGRQGPAGIRRAYDRLSPEAKNCITLENEENAWGLDDCLSLSDIIPTVLDIHHYWIREGSYVDPSDARIARLLDGWRGVRPVTHYSYSRDEHLPVDFKHDAMPDLTTLVESGHKKQKLRAHSDFYPNKAVNDYALSFLAHSDIMCESKGKNLASIALYESLKK